MKKSVMLASLTVWFCFSYAHPHNVSAAFIVDQAQTSFDTFFNLRFTHTTGQEFTPTLSSLDTVELLFDGPGGSFPIVPGSFSVGIHQGSIFGPLVATSSPVSLLTSIFHEVVRFEFSTPAALVPGQTYAIEINRLSDPDLPFFVGAMSADPYQGGRAIIDGGGDFTDFDLFFREGTSVAEPLALIVPTLYEWTLALLALMLGVIGMGVVHKR